MNSQIYKETPIVNSQDRDIHSCPGEDHLPDVWQQYNEQFISMGHLGLVKLDRMNNAQKLALMTCAVYDSLWINKNEINPDVTRYWLDQGLITQCLMPE